jgi:uncharacterized membrane protein
MKLKFLLLPVLFNKKPEQKKPVTISAAAFAFLSYYSVKYILTEDTLVACDCYSAIGALLKTISYHM